MQSLINMMIRTLFFTFIKLPFIIIGSLLPKKVSIRVPTTGAAVAEDEVVAPTSRQGRLDRKHYEQALDQWEFDFVTPLEQVADTIIELREAAKTPEQGAQLADLERENRAVFLRMVEKLGAEGAIYEALDTLEARNTGMKELKARRRELQARQDTVRDVLWEGTPS